MTFFAHIREQRNATTKSGETGTSYKMKSEFAYVEQKLLSQNVVGILSW